jgi:pimeloyl-ACP methyl ester carboxylesterase
LRGPCQSRLPHALHIVLVDLWGHGLTGTPVVPHVPSLFHALLDDLLDQLGWSSVNLVGFSFGGSLTVGYAASRPSRVTSFAIIAPAGTGRFSGCSSELQARLTGTDEAAARGKVLQYLEGGELTVPPGWKDRVARGEVVAEAVRDWQMREHRGHPPSMVAIFRDGGVMDNHDAFAKAVGTGIPSIAVLGGTDDVCQEEDLRKLGFANVHVLPGVGHGVVRERAAEVAELVCDFLVPGSKTL